MNLGRWMALSNTPEAFQGIFYPKENMYLNALKESTLEGMG